MSRIIIRINRSEFKMLKSKYELMATYEIDENIVFGINEDGNKMTGKPKVKMTRTEAIECILKHIPAAHNAARVIDFYIEAGMLEIVEESPLEGIPIGFKVPYNQREEWAECCKALHDQGWNIIKWS